MAVINGLTGIMEHPAFSGIIRDHPEVQEVVVLTEHQDSAEVQDLKLKHLGHRERTTVGRISGSSD
jgi:hypothetical protein